MPARRLPHYLPGKLRMLAPVNSRDFSGNGLMIALNPDDTNTRRLPVAMPKTTRQLTDSLQQCALRLVQQPFKSKEHQTWCSPCDTDKDREMGLCFNPK